MAKFEDKTIRDFEKYLELQKSGELNMLSSQVQERLGISKEEHQFIIKNYQALKEEYDNLQVVDEIIKDAKARVNGEETQEKTMGFNDIEHNGVQK